MRIGISLLNFRPGKIGGTETFLRELLAHLPSAAPGDTLVAIMDRDVARILSTPGFERVVVDRRASSTVAGRILEAYTPWRDRRLERQFEAARLDVALFPQQSVFPKRAPVRAVLTVVDVQHLIFPEHFGLFDRTFRPAIYPFSMERSERVVAISGHVRQTVIDKCGIEPSKVVVISLGFTPRGAGGVRPFEGVVGPYLYYPAFSHPHKNHETLLRTYATLKRSGGVTQKLVFTGGKTSHWKRIERLIGELGLRGDVVHLGLLPYEEVRRLYAGADAILFPTRYEGFGLPVLEAAEFGKKVIASRLEVFDEIGLPRPYQIDFADPEQLRAALSLPGPTVLGVRHWGWRDMAAAYVALLREVVASPK